LDAISRDHHQGHLQVPQSAGSSVSQASSSGAANGSGQGLVSSPSLEAALPELDKKMLVERIIRLQKALAKRSEKIDFLEEHNHQLVEEMKKKTRLIQHFILKEETGALATNRMDDHKKQLAKKGGTIMSSLYKSTAAAETTMTLELSLEMNRRLQAVLEDTILKNITLKDNMSTLGDEIARLSKESNSSSFRTN
jgi:hypothetical protein